ncbi:MAG: hypothetical protein JSV91_03605 [Phycisphaerales bacterium]|nr:MAG: hypothetical protein JSV91_03605 [Phycisphaerales bacterium]
MCRTDHKLASNLICFAAVFAISAVGHAQWSDDPSVNLTVDDREGMQTEPQICPTSDGGCYASWFDDVESGYDVYLQRLDAAGYAQWAHNGIRIAERSNTWCANHGMAVDAEDHAVIIFRDIRDGFDQIVAMRISPEGELVWGAGGVQLTNNDLDWPFVGTPRVDVASDGSILVGWTLEPNVYLHRLDHAGNAVWEEAVVISDDQDRVINLCEIHASDAGSVIASWTTMDCPRHLFAQKIDTDGNALWVEDREGRRRGGVVVYDGGALPMGYFPPFVTDGMGGAVFAWYGTSPALQCYAQHVMADGRERFPHNGVEVSTNMYRTRVTPAVSFDALTRETYVFWREQAFQPTRYGLYGQKLSEDGTRQWTDEGRAILPLGDTDVSQIRTLPTQDGAMVFFCAAPPSDEYSVQAVRVDGEGQIAWDDGFVMLADRASHRLRAVMSAYDIALLAWAGAVTGDQDIIAQNVHGDGTLGLRYADVNADGVVDIDDVFAVLGDWGPCPDPPAACPADVDESGVVDIDDLFEVLANWS